VELSLKKKKIHTLEVSHCNGLVLGPANFLWSINRLIWGWTGSSWKRLRPGKIFEDVHGSLPSFSYPPKQWAPEEWSFTQRNHPKSRETVQCGSTLRVFCSIEYFGCWESSTNRHYDPNHWKSLRETLKGSRALFISKRRRGSCRSQSWGSRDSGPRITHARHLPWYYEFKLKWFTTRPGLKVPEHWILHPQGETATQWGEQRSKDQEPYLQRPHSPQCERQVKNWVPSITIAKVWGLPETLEVALLSSWRDVLMNVSSHCGGCSLPPRGPQR